MLATHSVVQRDQYSLNFPAYRYNSLSAQGLNLIWGCRGWQWSSTRGEFAPRGHLAMCGDICGCHIWGGGVLLGSGG